MNNIKKIFALLALSFFAISCQNDGGDSQISTILGAAPDIQKDATKDSFLNLLALQNNEDVNFGFTVDNGVGNIASMDVIFFYTSGTTVTKATYQTNVTTFPQTFEVNQNDLIELFDHLNSSADFLLGDKITVTADITLQNGSLVQMYADDLSPNFGPEIANSTLYKLSQTFNVSCPSYLGGTYEYSTVNGTIPGFTSPTPLTGTVTLTDIGGGAYRISDASFGVWEQLYNDTPATGITLTDICNQISFSGSDKYGETYSYSDLSVEGNKLTFTWINSYNEGGTTTLTRTDGTDWPLLTL